MPAHPLSKISLDAPGGWDDGSMLSFVAPESSGFRRNVLVTCEPTSAKDASAYAEQQNVELAVALPEYKRYRTDDAALGKTPAVVAELSFKTADSPVIRQKVAYAVLDGIGYSVAMTCDDRGFSAARDQFDAVLKTVKLG